MTAQRSEATDVLVPLTEATDPDLVGTKAATLAALKAAGLPVPDGVVIPAGRDDVSTSALTEAIGRWGNVPVRCVRPGSPRTFLMPPTQACTRPF